MRGLVEGTLDAYGRVDAVVNSTRHPPTGDITDEEWRAGLDLVLLNVVRMARLVTPAMLRQGGGAVVNNSTFSAFEPSAKFPVCSSLRSAMYFDSGLCRSKSAVKEGEEERMLARSCGDWRRRMD